MIIPIEITEEQPIEIAVETSNTIEINIDTE